MSVVVTSEKNLLLGKTGVDVEWLVISHKNLLPGETGVDVEQLLRPVAWWNRSGCWAAAKTCCLVKLGWMLSNSCIKYHTSTCCLVKFGWMLIDHEPAYTPLRRGILPHGNFWVPWPSKHTVFRLSASELLLFVSVVLVLMNALYGIPNCDDLVS